MLPPLPAGASAASVAPASGATAAPSKKPRLTKFVGAMQSQSVNPSAGSGDGNAATDSFKEGRWDGDVQREGGRQKRDEGCAQQPARHVVIDVSRKVGRYIKLVNE